MDLAYIPERPNHRDVPIALSIHPGVNDQPVAHEPSESDQQRQVGLRFVQSVLSWQRAGLRRPILIGAKGLAASRGEPRR